MFPPQDRINYSEMRVQRIQIPVQVPVLKPVYVDYPYPNYVLVPGESKVQQLHRQYGHINNLFNHPVVQRQIQDAMESESSSSESEEEIITTKTRKPSQKPEVKKSKEIQTQTQTYNQQIPIIQSQQEIRQPIQLDHPGGDDYRPQEWRINQQQQNQQQQQQQQFQQSTLNQSQNQNQTRFLQNIVNTSTVSQGISQGRQALEQFKKRQSQLQQSGEAGISRTVIDTNTKSRKIFG